MSPVIERNLNIMRYKILKNFTILELLIVIAVITILIGILLPSVNKALDAGKRITCSSQLKQISLASRMYSMDNNEWIMSGYIKKSPNRIMWFQYIQYISNGDLPPYSESTPSTFAAFKIFKCPSELTPFGPFSSDTVGSFGYLHYGINTWVTGCYDPPTRKTSMLNSPSTAIQHGDLGIKSTFVLRSTYYVSFRHSAFAANIEYADGHVSQRKYRDLLTVGGDDKFKAGILLPSSATAFDGTPP